MLVRQLEIMVLQKMMVNNGIFYDSVQKHP